MFAPKNFTFLAIPLYIFWGNAGETCTYEWRGCAAPICNPCSPTCRFYFQIFHHFKESSWLRKQEKSQWHRYDIYQSLIIQSIQSGADASLDTAVQGYCGWNCIKWSADHHRSQIQRGDTESGRMIGHFLWKAFQSHPTFQPFIIALHFL